MAAITCWRYDRQVVRFEVHSVCAFPLRKFFQGRAMRAPTVPSFRPYAHGLRRYSQVFLRVHARAPTFRKFFLGRAMRAPLFARFKTGLDGRLRDVPAQARLVVRARRRSLARAGSSVSPSAVTVLQRSSGTSIGAHSRCALYAREKARTLIACLKPSYHSVP